MNINKLLRAYFDTALWSSVDDNCEPLDSHKTFEDIADETKEKAKNEIIDFLNQCGELLEGENLEQIMHDFWLTRNGHGAGFWDGDYEYKKSQELTQISENMGTIDLYIGDDNLIYSN